MQEGKQTFPSDGPSTAFWQRRGFKNAEEALAAISRHRDQRESTIKSFASLAYAFRGAVNYEDLKGYSPRELELITETLTEIRTKEEDAIKGARGKRK